MKNQTIIIIGVIILLVIIGGGYYLLSPKKEPVKSETIEPQVAEEEAILILSPEEIGLELTTTNDKRNVVIKIGKPQGIETIEYELTWGAKVKDKSSGELLDVARGTTSGEDPIRLDGKPYNAEIKMGTCSDVCHYDEGVNDIKIILKVTKTDGKVYHSEKTLEI